MLFDFVLWFFAVFFPVAFFLAGGFSFSSAVLGFVLFVVFVFFFVAVVLFVLFWPSVLAGFLDALAFGFSALLSVFNSAALVSCLSVVSAGLFVFSCSSGVSAGVATTGSEIFFSFCVFWISGSAGLESVLRSSSACKRSCKCPKMQRLVTVTTFYEFNKTPFY